MHRLLRACCDTFRQVEGLGYEIRRSAFAFFFIAALFFGLCLGIPSLGGCMTDYIASLLGGLQVLDEMGRLSPLALFLNNLRACVFTMLYGLVPFVFLPALALGTNAATLGGLGAWYLRTGRPAAGYFAALLPHGIFELPALIVSLAMGLWACGQLTRRCRGDGTARSLRNCLALMLRMLLAVLIPLLAAAALIEAYVTPVVAALLS